MLTTVDRWPTPTTLLLRYTDKRRDHPLHRWLFTSSSGLINTFSTALSSLLLPGISLHAWHPWELHRKVAPILPDNAHLQETVAEVRILALVTLLLIPLLGFLGALARKIFTLRLNYVAQILERLTNGQLSARVIIQTGTQSTLYRRIGLLVIRLAENLERQHREVRTSLEKLKQARERAAAANRAKSAFLANMSHQLRTPSTAS